MISLANKFALVTGGSRGIGRATALLLARAGAEVGITYHTRSTEAEEVVKAIRGMGRRAYAGGGDLSDFRRVEQVIREFRAAFGRLDLLVINHGVWPSEPVPVQEMQASQWRSTLATNLDSVFALVHEALPHMPPGGTIVLVSSTAGQRGEAFHADYAASKGALISLTKSLALECAPSITVNCIAPGWVDTDMCVPAFKGTGLAKISSTIPLGRPATVEEIAGPILFLCSDLARHITGEALNVNGGSVLCG
jgi:3-oxoacyl-[acyl-carrier protein] reductase